MHPERIVVSVSILSDGNWIGAFSKRRESVVTSSAFEILTIVSILNPEVPRSATPKNESDMSASSASCSIVKPLILLGGLIIAETLSGGCDSDYSGGSSADVDVGGGNSYSGRVELNDMQTGFLLGRLLD